MNLLSTLASEILSEHGCQIVQEEGHDGQLGCGIRLPLGNISFKFISMEDQ